MSRKSNQKLKLLYLLKILTEKTDEEHPLSTSELIFELKRYGISAERKSVYDDMEALTNFGVDVVKINSSQNLYYVGERILELPELKLLVDTVQSARFITPKKSLDLISKLERLTSLYNAKQLRRQVFVADRAKTDNERIFYNVDSIHSALMQDKKIAFKYFEWNTDKKPQLRRNGEFYEESPLGLAWEGENYYLIAYSETRKKIIHFRVDKMLEIKILDEAAEKPKGGFNTAVYTEKIFGMFGGDEKKVTLRASNRLVGIFIDRFGRGISILKDGDEHFTVCLDVAISPVFLSWLMGFGAEVQVLSPPELIGSVKAAAKELLDLYE